VRAGLVESSQQYPYSYMYLASRKAQGLKPIICGFVRHD
jgi:hypothetical protein